MKSSVISSYRELCEQLAFYADDEYREFVMRICPSERPFLGVRVPQIREIVSRVPSDLLLNFLKVEPVGYEEVLARGFLIARLGYEDMLRWFDSQIDYIDDWSTCDTFCSAISKMVRKNRAEFFEEKMMALLNDSREFAVRLGLVLLKCCYIDFEWLQVIFEFLEKLSDREEYYVRMGIAWLLCDCLIRFPEETLGYLSVSQLPKWTFNKAISKACDSHMVGEEMKVLLKGMRK